MYFSIGALCELSWSVYNFSLRVPDLFTIERYHHARFLDFPATNVLSVVVTEIQNRTGRGKKESKETKSLRLEDFEIFSFTSREKRAQRWYVAFLTASATPVPIPHPPPIPTSSSTPHPTPTFRPCTWQGARLCAPPVFSEVVHLEHTLEVHGTYREVVMFQRPEMALNFESAFYLEAICGNEGRHWYQLTMHQMIEKL